MMALDRVHRHSLGCPEKLENWMRTVKKKKKEYSTQSARLVVWEYILVTAFELARVKSD